MDDPTDEFHRIAFLNFLIHPAQFPEPNRGLLRGCLVLVGGGEYGNLRRAQDLHSALGRLYVKYLDVYRSDSPLASMIARVRSRLFAGVAASTWESLFGCQRDSRRFSILV
jgi:hypothetical protein